MTEPIDVGALQNIGPKTAERLRAVGIRTADDLEQAGSIEAFRRLKAEFPQSTSLNALYALTGALLELRSDQLPPDVRDRLRAAAEAL